MELWCKQTESGHMLWRGQLTPEELKNPAKLPVVDLSRTAHGRCMFRVDQLEQHDGHAPSLFKNQTDRDTYIKRVVNSAKAQIAKTGDMLCGYKKVS